MMLNANDNAPFAFGLGALGLIDGERPIDGALLYSLVDGAKFEGLGKIRLPGDGSVELHSLLGEMARKDANDAGPILLRHSLGAQCPVLAKILRAPDSAHFSSVIVSDLPVSSVLGRLKWLTDVAHEDGTEWVMRYYDPLILPHWLAVLDDAQSKLVLAGIGAWVYIDVRGHARIVRGTVGEAPPPFGREPMLLKQHQGDDLMNRTLPYMIMEQLVNDDPQALDVLPQHERYDFFALQLGKAHGYRLESVTDLKSYCMLSLMIGSEFDITPVAAEALKNAGSAPSFTERILAWTPEQWAMLEEKAASGMPA